MVVALLALVISLGGTAVASFGPFRGDVIIKKKSLSGNRLKNNSVTGRQIKSSTLGTVPSAVRARTADLATTVKASSLKGLIRGQMVDLNMFSGDPAKSVKVGPYQLQEQCYFDVNVSGTVAKINVIGPAGSVETEYSVVSNDTTDLGTFAQGHPVPSNTLTNVVQIADFGNFRRAGGTLVVRSDAGQLVQLDFSITVNNAPAACHVWGTATTGN